MTRDIFVCHGIASLRSRFAKDPAQTRFSLCPNETEGICFDWMTSQRAIIVPQRNRRHLFRQVKGIAPLIVSGINQYRSLEVGS
jgi:hypothetical protein